MSLGVDIFTKQLNVRGVLDRREADPLIYSRWGVPRIREALNLFTDDDPIDELGMRGPNKTGKTRHKAMFVIDCCRKVLEHDGVRIPQWRGPVEAAQLCLDYKQQLLSVKPAYLSLLGQWPHKVRYIGEALASIRIMPEGGNPSDDRAWSVIHFASEENKLAGVGWRADVIDIDEPGVIEILRELRKAGHAGRRSIILHGFTPTIRRQWAPIRDDYGETPRRSIRRIDQERAEVRWSLDEVEEWVLSPVEKAKMLRRYEGDPLHSDTYSAREHGDYTITEGACPFHVPTLELMLLECRDPKVIRWPIQEEELDEEGRPRIAAYADVEIFEVPKPGSQYYMTIDPSSGVDDDKHDPYEVTIGQVGHGNLVARAGGYLPGRLVGILGAGLCRQYNDAVADPEVNDRWGVNVVEGFHAAKYTHKFAHERRELGNGEWQEEIGFHNTQKTRPQIIGAVQAWVEARRAGIRYGECPSRRVIETLLDCILDETGKIVAAPGLHDEALITWGQLLRRAVTRSGRNIPEVYTPALTREQKLGRLIQGHDDDDDDEVGYNGGMAVGRRAPR